MTEFGPSFLYTTEQKRAQKAYNSAYGFAEEVSEEISKIREYKSAAEKFPAMIVNCGLLQALSFYKRKGNLRPVFEHLKEWFCDQYSWGTNIDFLERIINLDVAEYREKTQEALAFSTWLKRFADIRYEEAKQKQPKEKKKGEGNVS